MGDNSPRLLTVAVTSRALFDLEESHALFESDGVAAYAEFQRRLTGTIAKRRREQVVKDHEGPAG